MGKLDTPQKTNIASENRSSQKEFHHLPTIHVEELYQIQGGYMP